MTPRGRIPLTRPYLDDREADAVAAVLATGHVVQGSQVEAFEQAVAATTGSRYAFAVSSATTGLHLSLAALGLGPGDEVLVPGFTFPATGNVVLHVGAIPVLVDVRTDDYAIDVDDLRDKVSERTRAIMPVDPFGLPYDVDAVSALAAEHGLVVIEDAACALGARFDDRPAGSFGDIGVFSFHGRKAITTGEGGMVVTDDDDLAARLRMLRNHGIVRFDGHMEFEAAGFNYRLSDVAAAIGVVQMTKLPTIVARRRALATRMTNLLRTCALVQPPSEPDARVHTFQSYVVLLDTSVDRADLIRHLSRSGIESTIGTYALHMEPVYRRLGYEPADLPGARRLMTHSLTLPLFPEMTDDQVDAVAGAVADALTRG